MGALQANTTTLNWEAKLLPTNAPQLRHLCCLRCVVCLSWGLWTAMGSATAFREMERLFEG